VGDRQLRLFDSCPRGCIKLRTLPFETIRPQLLVPSQSAKEADAQSVAGKHWCGVVRIHSDHLDRLRAAALHAACVHRANFRSFEARRRAHRLAAGDDLTGS